MNVFSCDSGGDCECLCTAIASYAEECNRRGVYIHWRSQELCRMSHRHSTSTHLSTILPDNCVSFKLQLFSVRKDWFTIHVDLLALCHVQVSIKVHTLSVLFFPVWRAASALLAQSDMVRQVYILH